MTERIRAIRAYCPTIEIIRRVETKELASYISRQCAVAASDVRLVIEELRNAVDYFCCTGASVKVEGIGVYSPTIDLEGTIQIRLRPDRNLTYHINTPGEFLGTIRNRDAIGKTSDELVTIWNESHPGEQIPV